MISSGYFLAGIMCVPSTEPVKHGLNRKEDEKHICFKELRFRSWPSLNKKRQKPSWAFDRLLILSKVKSAALPVCAHASLPLPEHLLPSMHRGKSCLSPHVITHWSTPDKHPLIESKASYWLLLSAVQELDCCFWCICVICLFIICVFISSTKEVMFQLCSMRPHCVCFRVKLFKGMVKIIQ